MKGTTSQVSFAVSAAVFIAFIFNANEVYSIPLQLNTNPEAPDVPRSVDLGPEIVSSGEPTGSGILPGLREGAGEVVPGLREGGGEVVAPYPDGCFDHRGLLHVTGSTWKIGCKQTCECYQTPEGPIQDCTPPRCAIPMISPGCKIVPNPKRNDTSGENCCDVVECAPIYCTDSFGGKHEVLTSWLQGELDCFCQYDYQLDAPQTSCQLVQPEVDIPPKTPNEIQFPERIDFKREPLNETNISIDVCQGERNNTYSLGQTWRIGCQTECKCILKGEATVADCVPFGCPLPILLPGCTIVPNPKKDTVNSLNCCDVAQCPPKLCIGADQLLYQLNSVWYENNQACTCILNYNVNQAMRKCGSMEEIQSMLQNYRS